MRRRSLTWFVLAAMLVTMVSGISVSATTAIDAGALSWDFETEIQFTNMISGAKSGSDKQAITIDTINGGGWGRQDPGIGRYYVYGSPYRIKYPMIGGSIWDITTQSKDTRTFSYSDASLTSWVPELESTGASGNLSTDRTPASVKNSGDEENVYCAVVTTPSKDGDGNYYIPGMAIQLTADQLIPGREYVLNADVLSGSYKVKYDDVTEDTLVMDGVLHGYYQDLERYVWTGFGKPSKRQEADAVTVKPSWALNEANSGTGKVVATNRANGKASGHAWSKIQTTVTADPKFYENGAITFYIGMSAYNEAELKAATVPGTLSAEKIYFDNIKLTPVEANDGVVYNEAKIGKHWSLDERTAWAKYEEGDSGYDWQPLKDIGGTGSYPTQEMNDLPHGTVVTLEKDTDWSEAGANGYGNGYGTTAQNSANCLTVGANGKNTITGVRNVLNPEEWSPGTYTLTLYGATKTGFGNSDAIDNIELHAALFKGDTQLECRFSGGADADNVVQHEAIKKQFTENSTGKLVKDYTLGNLWKYWGYYGTTIEITEEMLEDEFTLVIYARTNDWSTVTTMAQAENQGILNWRNQRIYLDEISLVKESTAIEGNTKVNVYQRMVSDTAVSGVVTNVGLFDADRDGVLRDCAIQTGDVSGVAHRNYQLSIDDSLGWPYWKVFTWNGAQKPLNRPFESD